MTPARAALSPPPRATPAVNREPAVPRTSRGACAAWTLGLFLLYFFVLLSSSHFFLNLEHASSPCAAGRGAVCGQPSSAVCGRAAARSISLARAHVLPRSQTRARHFTDEVFFPLLSFPSWKKIHFAHPLLPFPPLSTHTPPFLPRAWRLKQTRSCRSRRTPSPSAARDASTSTRRATATERQRPRWGWAVHQFHASLTPVTPLTPLRSNRTSWIHLEPPGDPTLELVK